MFRLTHRCTARWQLPPPPGCRTPRQRTSPSPRSPGRLSPPPEKRDRLHEPADPWRRKQVMILPSCPLGVQTHPDDREGVLLLVVQVLLDVEERVEEDVGQLALFEVAQSDPSWRDKKKQNKQNTLTDEYNY